MSTTGNESARAEHVPTPMRIEDVTLTLLKDVVHTQRRDLTGIVGIIGIIVTIFGSAVGLGVFFASSIGGLDERIRVVEQEVAVVQVEIERLREDVSAIRDLLETHVLTISNNDAD